MTAKPGGEDEEEHQDEGTREPDLNAVGDNHMPEDVRQSVRERSQQTGDHDDT